jgi:streptogramin lyase
MVGFRLHHARGARIAVALAIAVVALPVAAPVTPASAAVTPPAGWVTQFPTGMNPWNSAAGPDNTMWFVEPSQNSIASVTNDGTITQHPILTPNSFPQGIARGADDNMWFTEVNPNQIGRMTPDGTVTEYAIPTPGYTYPESITAGPDGNLWFTEANENQIGRITPDGAITEIPFTDGSVFRSVDNIITGADGRLWFTERVDAGAAIGAMTTSGIVSEYLLPDSGSAPYAITNGPDGNIWFSELNVHKIGRITPDGTITEYALPANNEYAYSLTPGPDGNVWFGVVRDPYGGALARITPDGTITEYAVPDSNAVFGLSKGPTGQLWWAAGNSIDRGNLSVVTANGGANQQTTSNTAFAANLAACVTDLDSQPVSTDVTFTAPASGASGTFAGGGTTATVTSDVSGCATAPVFTANDTAGFYSVTAQAGTTSTAATLALTNISPDIRINEAGVGITRMNANATATPALEARVTSDDVPLAGATVTFTAPSSGASGTFANGTTVATALSGVDGIATAPEYTANSTLGQYEVTAATAGASSDAHLAVFNDPPASTLPVTEYPDASTGEGFGGIASGPDGALWYTASGAAVNRITTGGTITSFPVATHASDVTTGPDGNLWFTGGHPDEIGRITTDGTLTEFPLGTSDEVPRSITAGPDGALWFTEAHHTGRIGRITTDGTFTSFALSDGSYPGDIASGPDGALWFTELEGNRIGRLSVDGALTEFAVPTANAAPAGITTGPDGNLWFTESFANKIGRLSTDGLFTEFAITTAFTYPYGITAAPDGNLWFTEAYGDRLGRITTTGGITEFYVPTVAAFPFGITAGPDDNIWITEGITNSVAMFSITPTLSVATGSDQSTAPGSAFSAPLSAHVVDTDGNPMAGVTVTFTAPADGAGGTFAGDGITSATVRASAAPTTAVVTSDAEGNAVAPAFTANDAGGSYAVTAKGTGYPSTATFSLTNTESGGGGGGGGSGGGNGSAGGTDGTGSTGNDPVAAAASGTLPFTGAPTLQLLFFGIVLLGAGLGATAATRRRRRPIV